MGRLKPDGGRLVAPFLAFTRPLIRLIGQIGLITELRPTFLMAFQPWNKQNRQACCGPASGGTWNSLIGACAMSMRSSFATRSQADIFGPASCATRRDRSSTKPGIPGHYLGGCGRVHCASRYAWIHGGHEGRSVASAAVSSSHLRPIARCQSRSTVCAACAICRLVVSACRNGTRRTALPCCLVRWNWVSGRADT